MKAIDRTVLPIELIEISKIHLPETYFKNDNLVLRDKMKKEIVDKYVEVIEQKYEGSGDMSPILLSKINNDYIVVDGRYRIAAHNELSRTKIKCSIDTNIKNEDCVSS